MSRCDLLVLRCFAGVVRSLWSPPFWLARAGIRFLKRFIVPTLISSLCYPASLKVGAGVECGVTIEGFGAWQPGDIVQVGERGAMKWLCCFCTLRRIPLTCSHVRSNASSQSTTTTFRPPATAPLPGAHTFQLQPPLLASPLCLLPHCDLLSSRPFLFPAGLCCLLPFRGWRSRNRALPGPCLAARSQR